MTVNDVAKDARGELRAVKSRLAVWVDANPRKTAAAIMAAAPLAAIGVFTVIGWLW